MFEFAKFFCTFLEIFAWLENLTRVPFFRSLTKADFLEQEALLSFHET